MGVGGVGWAGGFIIYQRELHCTSLQLDFDFKNPGKGYFANLHKTLGHPDGSFSQLWPETREVLGLYLGCLSSRVCIILYSALQTVQMSGVCNTACDAVQYKESLKSFDGA